MVTAEGCCQRPQLFSQDLFHGLPREKALGTRLKPPYKPVRNFSGSIYTIRDVWNFFPIALLQKARAVISIRTQVITSRSALQFTSARQF